MLFCESKLVNCTGDVCLVGNVKLCCHMLDSTFEHAKAKIQKQP